MVETDLRYPVVLFDWGDTVMYDDPTSTVPMVDWPNIRVVEGITDLLAYLRASGRRVILATSASVSDEGQIRAALARADLDSYFSRIYCFKNTGLSKSEAFFRYILKDLDIPAKHALMVGDSFEKDVQAPNKVGIYAVWFSETSNTEQRGKLHASVHSMRELQTLFKDWDGK
jgi:FMN phosphatase YigB (HAD superfamily)